MQDRGAACEWKEKGIETIDALEAANDEENCIDTIDTLKTNIGEIETIDTIERTISWGKSGVDTESAGEMECLVAKELVPMESVVTQELVPMENPLAPNPVVQEIVSVDKVDATHSVMSEKHDNILIANQVKATQAKLSEQDNDIPTANLVEATRGFDG